MTGWLHRQLTPARLAAASTSIVFLAAFTISWESLRVLAIAAGIPELLAPLFPLTIDAVMVTATTAAVALRAAPVRTRLYTWVLVAAGISVSVLGNGVHSQAHGDVLVLPWWAAAAASAVPALSLAASLHLLVLVLRHGQAATPKSQPTSVLAELSPSMPNQQPRVGARAEVRRMLAKQGSRLTAEQVARRANVSVAHARRLIQQERAPRVVDGKEAAH